MRDTPEAAFAEASAAMVRGDWHAFFACIDRDSLLTIAENDVGRFINGGDQYAAMFAELCARNGVPAELPDKLRAAAARIVESAKAWRAAGRPQDPTAMIADSLRHKAMVDDYRDAVKSIVKASANIHAFVADLEIALRQETESGSVSTRLFVDETLEDVSVSGSGAKGIRRMRGGATEAVSFVRRRGGEWFIKPFTRSRT
jgi:hypothetical protein